MKKLKRNLSIMLILALLFSVFPCTGNSASAATTNGSKQKPYSAYKARIVDIYGARYYGRARIKLIDYKDGKKASKYLKKNGVKKKAGNSKEYVYLKFKIEYIEGWELILPDIILTPYSSYFDSGCEEQLRPKEVKCKDGVQDLTKTTMFPGESVICKQVFLVNSGSTPITYMVHSYDDNGNPTETWFKTER